MSSGPSARSRALRPAHRCRGAPKLRASFRSVSGSRSPPAGVPSRISSRQEPGAQDQRTGRGPDKFLSRSTDGDAVHTQGRLADADGHGLAILAASANAGIELEVISDHADAVEVGRTIADQHGALERLRKLATIDLVGLGD